MNALTSSTSHAIYKPSGKVIEAAHVAEDIKRGPWVCPSKFCNLPLTHTRGTRVAAPQGTTVERAPYFKRKTPGTLHSAHCDVHVNDLENMSSHEPRRGYIPRNEIVLLRVGSRPDTNPPKPKAPSRPSKSTGPDYAGRPGSMSSILKLIESLGGQEAMAKLWHTHHGERYRWNEIAYGAEHAEYVRLHKTVSERFNPDEHRPWIVWGTVQAGAQEAKNDSSKKFLRIGASYSAQVPKVRIYIPNTPEFAAVIRKAVAGTRVAFVISGVKETDIAHGIYGSLNKPDDIAFLD